jgi:hypothetical protein
VTIKIEKSDRKSKGGRVEGHRATKSPQSRGRLSAISVCQLEGCDKPLTGRQRVACSDSHRALASKQRRQDALPPTRTTTRQSAQSTQSSTTTTLGSREPAYSLVPKHTTSKGPQAVEMMQRAGYTLDEWQEDVLRAALGRHKGRWSAPEVCVLAPRQNGKSELAIAAGCTWRPRGPRSS